MSGKTDRAQRERAIVPEGGAGLLIDAAMPRWDATRVEHRVIAGSPGELFRIALEANLSDVPRVSPATRFLFALRGQIERLVSLLPGRRPSEADSDDEPRLGSLRSSGEWISLGQDPPHEIAFGSLGRFWGGETRWETIDADAFAHPSGQGLARIACAVSFRAYGREQTLVSYETRVQATDAAARRAFMRYWRAVSPLIGVVLRSFLKLIDAINERERGKR